jgi:hypothetical protein
MNHRREDVDSIKTTRICNIGSQIQDLDAIPHFPSQPYMYQSKSALDEQTCRAELGKSKRGFPRSRVVIMQLS